MINARSWRFHLQPFPFDLHRRSSCVSSYYYVSISSPRTVSASTSWSFIDEKALPDFFDHVLRGCSTVQQCRQVHSQVVVSGMICRSGFLAARLVSVYSRLDLLLDAHNVFDAISSYFPSNLLLWNSILRADVSHGLYANALELYVEMNRRGVPGDGFTFPLILRTCRFLASFRLCRILHNHVLQMGFRDNLHVVNEMLATYSRVGRMVDASNLFDKMPVRDHISWNTMISGFSQNYDCDGAVSTFERMKTEGFEPNEVTWTSLLSCHSRCGLHEEVIRLFDAMRMRGIAASGEALAVFFSVCADLGAFDRAENVHGYVIKGGFEDYLFLKNALICVYGKQGKVKDAKQLFQEIRNKSTESWNSLMTSFVEAGLCHEAISVFYELEEMNDSSKVKANVITWTALINGCASQGRGEESLELFRRMQLSEVLPNSVTISCILSICAELAALNLGREVHGHVFRASMGNNILVQNGLLNMYLKCGSLDEGNLVFETIMKKDLISWNSMITGYGMHGHGESALCIFDQMIKAGFQPDEVTLIAVLSACSHAGLVKKGREIFYTMSKQFGIEPQVEHYACIVDLLGRAGCLKEASEIVKSMPMEPNACVWGALLNSCRMHRNTDVAEEIASQFFSEELEMTGSYMLLSNIFSAGGRWEESAKVRASAKTRDLKKVPGSSWIELKKKVYKFSAGATLQAKMVSVYEVLEYLVCHMGTKGSVLRGSFSEENLDAWAE